ncbi:MAG: hypothetical protein SGARI_001901, partial [Bacillariaceae sp.]
MAPMRRIPGAAPPLAAVISNLNYRIAYYDVQFSPQPQRPHRMAVLDNEKVENVNRLLEHWHAAVESEQGILHRYFVVKRDLYYSRAAGPMTQRQRKDVLTAAALVCLQYGRGIGALAGHTESSCGEYVGDTEAYERMTVMACTIVHRFPIPEDLGLTDPITFDEIMNFNLYTGIREILSRLKTHGIVSEKGEGTKGGKTIMDAVYLPTFLFIDALLEDEVFRSHCKVRNIWVGEKEPNSELDQIRNNPRIFLSLSLLTMTSSNISVTSPLQRQRSPGNTVTQESPAKQRLPVADNTHATSEPETDENHDPCSFGLACAKRSERRSCLEDTDDETSADDPVSLFENWDCKSSPVFWDGFLGHLRNTEDMMARFSGAIVRDPVRFATLLRNTGSPFVYDITSNSDKGAKERCLVALDLCIYAAVEAQRAAQQKIRDKAKEKKTKKKKTVAERKPNEARLLS